MPIYIYNCASCSFTGAIFTLKPQRRLPKQFCSKCNKVMQVTCHHKDDAYQGLKFDYIIVDEVVSMKG